MRRAQSSAVLRASLVAALCLLAPLSYAGDEDVKTQKAPVEQKVPEDTSLPKEAEAPELSVGDTEEPAPIPQLNEPTAPAASTAPSRARKAQQWDPDRNVDYSRLLGSVPAVEAQRGVLPPAMGFRGYRSNMIAIGSGDRVPGYGVMVEYSWNRVGIGAYASYMPLKFREPGGDANGFGGGYALYRWLPFDVSPYFLMGLEIGSETIEPLGGLAGAGVEARIYDGWTALVGWTFHSTMRRGYLGGAFGWSF